MSDFEIRLRALEPSDLDILYKWENDPEVWKVSHTLTPYSKYILQKYIENSHYDIYQTRQLRLMIDLIESEGKDPVTIGTIDLFDFDPYNNRAGVGILIGDKSHRKKGYATAALKQFLDYAFNTLQLHQVYCNIAEGNEDSLKLFQNLGFEIVGVKKEWLKRQSDYEDEYTLQLLREWWVEQS